MKFTNLLKKVFKITGEAEFAAKEYRRSYYLKNKERIAIVSRNWRKRNLKKMAEYVKVWRKNNPKAHKNIRVKKYKTERVKLNALRESQPTIWKRRDSGRWQKIQTPEELELLRLSKLETKLKLRNKNAEWQKTVGRERHNELARESARRKAWEKKEYYRSINYKVYDQ